MSKVGAKAVSPLIVAVAVALSLALCAVSARAEEPSGDLTTALYPGDNLVGWMAAEAPAADLFEAVPAIEAVWAWDARERRWLAAAPSVPASLHTLRTLKPGMGLRVHIGGDAPVDWTRSAVPARGLVELSPGFNLVAWSGPDESTIDYLARGIGASFSRAWAWDAENASGFGYDAEAPEGAASFPAMHRGDALWVDASRGVNWLQPTGVLPRIEFPGGASESVRRAARDLTATVIEFFGEHYAIEADPASFMIVLPKDGDALYGAARELGYSSIGLRTRWEKASGWVDRNFDYHYQWLVTRQPRPFWGAWGLIAHEYFHVIQNQLASALADPLATVYDVPLWVVEGSAQYAQGEYFLARGDAQDKAAELLSRNVRTFHESYPPLDDPRIGSFGGSGRASDVPEFAAYALGHAATALLADLAGPDSWIELWRHFAETPTGPHGRWISTQSYQGAFQATFDMALEEFYSEFRRRRSGVVAARSETAVTTISGRVTGPDGLAQSGLQVRVRGYSGDDIPSVVTGSDGAFALVVPTDSVYELSVLLTGSSCEVYPNHRGGVAASYSDLDAIRVGSDAVAGIDMQIPADFCAWRIGGHVVDSNGQALAGALVEAHGFGREAQSFTDTDGSFAMTVKQNGKFRLSIELADGCTFWYDEDQGAAGSSDDATRVAIDGGDAALVYIQVPDMTCTYQIRGRVVDSDGSGMENDKLLTGEGRTQTEAATAEDGRFAIIVPTNGEYRLQLDLAATGSRGGCRAYFADSGLTNDRDNATLLRVAGGDVDGVWVVVPADPCGGLIRLIRLIRGRLVDDAGAGIADVQVAVGVVDPPLGFASGLTPATTAADGSFEINLNAGGDYMLWVDFSDDCSGFITSDGRLTRAFPFNEAITRSIDDVQFRLVDAPCS